jgi:hypothetical protein
MKLIYRIRFWFQNLLMTLGFVRRPCSVSELTMTKQKHFLRKHRRERESSGDIKTKTRKIEELEEQLIKERIESVLTINSLIVEHENANEKQAVLISSIRSMLKGTIKYQTPALIREKYSHHYFSKSIEEILNTIDTYMGKKKEVDYENEFLE